MNRKIAAKHRFRLQKLERLVRVKNVNGTHNSGGAIIHEVEVNMYYKSHVEMSQTSFGHISTNSSTIPPVSKPA